jgi:class 3 adenylate cyclase
MPLFMDRHDIPGVKAEDVAQAHLADLAVAARHDVKFLTYWFDPDRGEAFCLAEAPAGEALTAVHRETHGLIPNEIISVSEDNLLRFLGRINEPLDHTAVGNPFRAVLFTDLEGSTNLLESVGEAAYMVLLTEHDLIIRRALVATRGREVKHTGDGIMASFENVSSALGCALAIQDGFTTRAAAGEGPELRVRIGIAAGEPVDHNDDLFGSTVTLASRICAAADAGHVLTSEVVFELGRTKGFSFGPGQDRTLKGFSSPTRLFELVGTRP